VLRRGERQIARVRAGDQDRAASIQRRSAELRAASSPRSVGGAGAFAEH
jgi:hypothetical protein